MIGRGLGTYAPGYIGFRRNPVVGRAEAQFRGWQLALKRISMPLVWKDRSRWAGSPIGLSASRRIGFQPVISFHSDLFLFPLVELGIRFFGLNCDSLGNSSTVRQTRSQLCFVLQAGSLFHLAFISVPRCRARQSALSRHSRLGTNQRSTGEKLKSLTRAQGRLDTDPARTAFPCSRPSFERG